MNQAQKLLDEFDGCRSYGGTRRDYTHWKAGVVHADEIGFTVDSEGMAQYVGQVVVTIHKGGRWVKDQEVSSLRAAREYCRELQQNELNDGLSSVKATCRWSRVAIYEERLFSRNLLDGSVVMMTN